MFCFPGCFPLCQTDRSEIIPNIPVRRKRNGPFQLNSDRNFRNLWHNAEASPKSRINENGGNPFHTNHMTTFLCHVTTSFGHHVISFLQPTVQNSNGRFTTLVILIVRPAELLFLCKVIHVVSSIYLLFVPHFAMTVSMCV